MPCGKELDEIHELHSGGAEQNTTISVSHTMSTEKKKVDDYTRLLRIARVHESHKTVWSYKDSRVPQYYMELQGFQTPTTLHGVAKIPESHNHQMCITSFKDWHKAIQLQHAQGLE